MSTRSPASETSPSEVRTQAEHDAPKKKRWPTKDEKRAIRERARKVRRRLMKHASARRLSFTALMKRELPGWPKWRGPRLTLARAESIADRLDRKAAAAERTKDVSEPLARTEQSK